VDESDGEDKLGGMDVVDGSRRGRRGEGEGGGDVLKCMVLQVRITENHQNGKDTHVRGFQVFARDERRKGGLGMSRKRKSIGKGKRKSEEGVGVVAEGEGEGDGLGALEKPDWMGEPELR
jgi:anaphase-promoting complex subunit 10